MAWAYRTATSGSGTGTAITVTAPGSLANSDVMDVWIGYEDEPFTTTLTPPAGWTVRFAEHDDANLGFRFACYTRVASGEGASWEWTLSASQNYLWACNAASGGSGNLTGTPASVRRPNGTAAYSSPSITPTSDGALIRAGFYANTNASLMPVTPDASPVATEEIELEALGNNHLYIERYEQATAGAQALDMTFNASNGQRCLTGIIAWELSGGGGGASKPKSCGMRGVSG
jgi:hypothetical protein